MRTLLYQSVCFSKSLFIGDTNARRFAQHGGNVSVSISELRFLACLHYDRPLGCLPVGGRAASPSVPLHPVSYPRVVALAMKIGFDDAKLELLR